MSHRALIVSAAVIACAACGDDAAGPDESILEVRLSATAGTPAIASASDGSLVIECAIRMSATAFGSDESAVWDGAILRWFVGADRTTPIQVDTLSAAHVTALWGSDRVTAGTIHTDWLLSASIPFIAVPEFFFRANGTGERRSVLAAAGCGLPLAVFTPEPPTVSNVEIDSPTPFEPGDTLIVSYSAAAAGDLFCTSVVIDGAWQHTQHLAEGLAETSRREVRLAIPGGVTLGAALDVAVVAMDAHGQTTTSASLHTAPLVDETPPYFMDPPRVVAQYGAGDPIPINFRVRDNHALGDLIVEIGGQPHTFPLDGDLVTTWLSVTADEAWLGATGFAATVTDAGGRTARYEAHPDSFRIFPVVDRPRTSWVGAHTYRNAAWDDANERLFVTFNEPLVAGDIDLRRELWVVSTVTMAPLTGHALPAPAVAVDFTVSGDTAIVSLELGALAVVDLLTGAVTVIELSPLTWLRGDDIVVLANGHALVELVDFGGTPHVALVDLADGAVIWSEPLERGRITLARSRDRSIVGLRSVTDACTRVYTAATQTLGPCLPGIGIQTDVLDVDETGSRLLSAQYLIDLSTGSFRNTAWGMSEQRVPVTAFAPDGTTMYRSDETGLSRIRIADGVVLERIPFPVAADLFISADGSTLIAPRNNPNSTSEPVAVERVMLR